MPRAMDELISKTALLNDLPTDVINFPPEWAMACRCF
jgi:hypothetical protein